MRRRNRLLVAIVVIAVMGIPVAAVAAAGFDDVADDNVFKSDIQWLADAGVTKGCNPPANTKYCPQDNVTREQMAAFMHRLADNQVVDAGTVQGMTAAQLKGPLGFYTKDAHTAASTKGYYDGDAWCDTGDVAVGGGVQLHANSPDFVLIESMPTHAGAELPSGWTPSGWHGEVWLNIDLGVGFWSFRTWAVCADVTP